jgi:hypothetical protein
MSNTGSAILTFKDFSTSGNFAISANACLGAEVPAWTKPCKISFTFTPTMLGKQTGTLTLSDNSGDSPQTIQLSGIGVEPATLRDRDGRHSERAEGIHTYQQSKHDAVQHLRVCDRRLCDIRDDVRKYLAGQEQVHHQRNFHSYNDRKEGRATDRERQRQ